jgi:ferritin
MGLSEALQGAINEQVKNEVYSAHLYLAMSAQCEAENLPGMAHWLRIQFMEEWGHALKLFDYVNERGGRAEIRAIDQPPARFGSPLELFQDVAAHEARVTAMINDLYALAAKENDYAAQIMLQWFITEQVEEEKSAGEIVDQLKMIGDNAVALLMLDRELGARVAEPGMGPMPATGESDA